MQETDWVRCNPLEVIVRIQSQTKVTVKEKVIGAAAPLICLPLVAQKKSELLQQAQTVQPLDPDLLEWRIDSYGTGENPDTCLGARDTDFT